MNTNKHLLDTKLKSLVHYNSEIKRFEEAIEVTKSTKSDILQSLVEFFPFENGDLLQNGENIYLVKLNNDIGEYKIKCIEKNGSIAFCVWLLEPDYRDQRQEWRQTRSYQNEIMIDKLDSFKIIGNTKK